jgi:hypothetical protein
MSKKSTSTMDEEVSGGGSALVKRVRLLWKNWEGDDPPAFLEDKKFQEKFAIPGCDLLVLDSENRIPQGPELEALYLTTFEAAQVLERELGNIIEASTFDAPSKRAILKTILDLGLPVTSTGE